MTFEYINRNGDILLLTENENFKLINVDAQTAAAANISSSTTGGIDGDKINNIQTQPRTIILDLKIIKDVELTKRDLLSIIKIKQAATIRWTQEEKTVVINGIVEEIALDRWTNDAIMQVTIHCENPYWSDVDYINGEVSSVTDLHYFTATAGDMLYFLASGAPFGVIDPLKRREIINTGDVAVGMEIEITCGGAVRNPIIYAADGSYFGVGSGSGSKAVNMTAGDVVKISTVRGKKSVKYNGTSILNKIKASSTWLQLEAGSNIFTASADSGADNVAFSISYKRLYV